MTAACLPDVRNLADSQRASVGNFALQQVFEGSPEGVMAKNAYGQRICRTFESVRGPLHEIGEVADESGFELILVDLLSKGGGDEQDTESYSESEPGQHGGISVVISKT